MARLFPLALLALCGSCMPFDAATADASWVLADDGGVLFDHRYGDRLDYTHGEAVELITLHADGAFELAIRNCTPGDFVRVSGQWEAISASELELRADEPFGQICCPRDTLIIERTKETERVNVWAIDELGQRETYGYFGNAWTLGEPCLRGCCSSDGGVCDPTVEACPGS